METFPPHNFPNVTLNWDSEQLNLRGSMKQSGRVWSSHTPPGTNDGVSPCQAPDPLLQVPTRPDMWVHRVLLTRIPRGTETCPSGVWGAAAWTSPRGRSARGPVVSGSVGAPGSGSSAPSPLHPSDPVQGGSGCSSETSQGPGAQRGAQRGGSVEEHTAEGTEQDQHLGSTLTTLRPLL